MANVNVKFGLKPISVIGGGANLTNQYFIKSDASAIFQGSPVEVELTGGTAAIITSADGDVNNSSVFLLVVNTLMQRQVN